MDNFFSLELVRPLKALYVNLGLEIALDLLDLLDLLNFRVDSRRP
jgi:hypothetical protein